MSSSRERLKKTLNHEQPDRVVVDLGSTAITGIHANALHELRKALGLSDEIVKISETLQLLGSVDEDVRQALGLDVVDVTNINATFGIPIKGWKPWKLQNGLDVLVPGQFNTKVDEKGNTYLYPQGNYNYPPSGKMPKGGNFFDILERGNNSDYDEDTVGAREDFKDDYCVLNDQQLRLIEDRTNDYYANTEYGLISGIGLASIGDFAVIPGAGVPYPKGIRNLEDFIMAHQICPNYIHELFEYHVEVGIENAKLLKEACGDKIEAVYVSGTDFGTQNGPFMSLDAFRELYKPYYKRINDWIHENTNWKTFFHSCGAVSCFLQDFYEMGVDILNPVQLSANGMDARMLKDKWGDKITFWGGGIDTQKTLPFGRPEEVYDEALERLHILAEGGGYVFNAIHNIQAPTSAENILAMFDAVKAYNEGK